MKKRRVSPSLWEDISLAIDDLSQRAARLEGDPKMTRNASELCEYYRAMAICAFYRKDGVNRFFHYLLHSSLTRRRCLTLCATLSERPAIYMMASEVGSLLDAVAARQWALAADIAKLTTDHWTKNSEYEEDYCHGEFWRQLCLAPQADQITLFSRWAGVIGETPDPRLDLARALLDKDAHSFSSALAALLAHNEAVAAKMVEDDDGEAGDPPFKPNRWISIPGLAWIAAAERAGMTIAQDFEVCPSELRTASYATFAPFAYPNLGL